MIFFGVVLYFGLNGYSYDLMIKYTKFTIKKVNDNNKNEGDDNGKVRRNKKQFKLLKIDSQANGNINIAKNK